MFFGEVPRFARFNVDHTNDAALGDQRNGQFRANVGNRFDVAWILSHIINQHRLP